MKSLWPALLANAVGHLTFSPLTHRVRCPRNLRRLPQVMRRSHGLRPTSNLWEPARKKTTDRRYSATLAIFESSTRQINRVVS